MKHEENIAKDFFEFIGYDDIKFEPKGNRTPDFVLDGKIAVEVRRLNRFYNNEPLEKVAFNFFPKILNQIENFKTEKITNISSFVSVSYIRPIKYNKDIKKRINDVLETHLEEIGESKKYIINESLTLDFIPSEKWLGKIYNFGMYSDLNDFGFIVSDIVESLKIIIPEKTAKVENYKSEYKVWWLALIDNVGYGLSKNEIIQLKSLIDFDLYFDDIVFISPLNFENGKFLKT
ncbi:hypothetical protein [Winogradskyella jejuensis]|uniref:Uncharacterized protein n=1 Tax=Winogradskyella jejuensis TaxID=1089305 RepID=A0A1M5PL33_9FLAO|nr:hypothetical protein [Winogradskyella jejuensis]SHH02477.1 hypothetical protein SAMN05444148_1523 [Winogradskyella jejuensis]